MTFLQTIIVRKHIKIKELSPGNGGGTPEMTTTGEPPEKPLNPVTKW
jgi:hypothetical protein